MMTGDGCAGAEVEKLVEKVREVTKSVGDPLGDVARLIRSIIPTDADPYLLAGVLIEGAVQAVVQRIPAERRSVVSFALLQLLADRLRQTGQLDQPPG